MKVEIFSDIACPFCYIGTRNFARALEASGKREEVEVIWRSFQLDPSAPARAEGDLYDHLTRKFGVSRDEAMAMSERVISMGHEADIDFEFENAFAVNTFDAHRLLKLAAKTGVETELAELLFEAYFTGSADLSNRGDLVRLAVAAGIPEASAREVAEGEDLADEVRSDQALASEFGIAGVPAFIFDRSTGVSGAQPPELLRRAIDQALVSAA